MAYADYEHCPGCDGKVLYTVNTEVPDDVTCWHRACLDAAFAEARADPAREGAGDDGIEIYDATIPKAIVPPYAPFRNRLQGVNG